MDIREIRRGEKRGTEWSEDDVLIGKKRIILRLRMYLGARLSEAEKDKEMGERKKIIQGRE